MTAPATQRENRWVLSVFTCAAVIFFFLATDVPREGGQMWHWFLAPVFLCGVLTMEDGFRWLRGEVDVFDPIGVLGLCGAHFFFLAPLLHVHWAFWMDIVPPPPEWRTWLGGMALLNLLGLIVYRLTRGGFRRGASAPVNPVASWRLDAHRFQLGLMVALSLAAALQILIYASYGGIWGYIQAVETEQHAFLAVGRIAIVSDSFPILLLMGYVVLASRQQRIPGWFELCVVTFGFVAISLLFGGLHGSRSNVVYALFWAVGIIHLGVRPVPRRLLIAGAAALVVFVYLYGFYKSAGVAGLRDALKSSESRAAVEHEIRRPLAGALLGDFGRSDVQAYLLYRLVKKDSDFKYGMGRTYYGTVVALVPGPLWRDRPATKVKEGTNALLGQGMYRERALSATIQDDRFIGMSSKVYGLAGETMLNFGPLAVPFAFAILGAVVGWTHRCISRWSRLDPRRLFLPLMTNLCLIVLIGDSDNVLAFLEGDALFPLLVVGWASHRVLRPAAAHPPLEAARRPGVNSAAEGVSHA